MVQMVITLLPTSAQERRLNTVFQPRSYAPVVSSQSRRLADRSSRCCSRLIVLQNLPIVSQFVPRMAQ